jgi:hypothetical protein
MRNRIIKFWISIATESLHHLSMMPKHLLSFLMILLVVGQSLLAQQTSPAQDRNLGIELTGQVLSKRVEKIENACDLRQFKTAEDWAKHREVLRQQLVEMYC